MKQNKELTNDLLDLIHGGFISKNNVYKLIFTGYIIRKYKISTDFDITDYLTFRKDLKERVTKLGSSNELNLLDQCLTSLASDFNLKPLGLNQMINLINNYSLESYQEFAKLDLKTNFEKYSSDIPGELARLVLKIANPKKDSNIADLNCGNGNFLAIATNDTSNLLGLTDDREVLLNTELRLAILNSHYLLDYEDKINIKDLSNTYDLVFSLVIGDTKGKDITYYNFPNTKNNSILWKRIDNAISMLNAKGKAIFILNNGPLFINKDLYYRKYLIDKGLVETIIELPDSILYNTRISTTMLILSKTNNTTVNMIDASSMFKENTKHQKIIDTLKIYNAYLSNDNKVSKEDIASRSYSFIPSNYLDDPLSKMTNPKKLEDYVNIYRGYRGKTGTNSKSTIKIIQVGNLNNYIDLDELEDISYDENMDKELLKDKDIVLSRITNNSKCQMIHLQENEKVIASENIIVLRVKDSSVLNPYYLEEYLNSEVGKKSIFASQAKFGLAMMQTNRLKESYIDLMNPEKQREIEQLAIKKYKEIINNKLKIKTINESINKILED